MACIDFNINNKLYDVDSRGLKIKEDLSYRTITDFNVVLKIGDERPRSNDRVIIMQDNEVLYYGKIAKIKSPKFTTGHEVLRYKLSCLPPLSILDNRLITASFIDTTADAVIDYFKEMFIIPEEIAENFVIDDFSDILIDRIVFNTESVEIALNKFVDRLNAITYVNMKTNTWYLVKKDTLIETAYVFDDINTACISDIQTDEIGTEIRNKHYQMGASGLTVLQTQREHGDDEKQAFLTAYPVGEKPEINVDGVEKIVGKLEDHNEVFNGFKAANIFVNAPQNAKNESRLLYMNVDIVGTFSNAGTGVALFTTSNGVIAQDISIRLYGNRIEITGQFNTNIRNGIFNFPVDNAGEIRIAVDFDYITFNSGYYFPRLWINGTEIAVDLNASIKSSITLVSGNFILDNWSIIRTTGVITYDLRLNNYIGIVGGTEMEIATDQNVNINDSIFGIKNNCNIITAPYTIEEYTAGLIINKGSVTNFVMNVLVDGISSFIDLRPEWLYAEKSNEISQREDLTPLTPIQIVEINYKGIFNASVIVQDDEDITRRKNRAGGTGIIERVNFDQSIDDFGVATDTALAKLEQYLIPREKITFIIRQEDFDKTNGIDNDTIQVGKKVTFNLPEIYIKGSYIVNEIEKSFWYEDDESNIKFKYRYTAFSGDYKKGNAQSLRNMSNQRQEAKITYNGDETAIIIERFGNKLRLRENVLFVIGESTYPANVDGEMINPTQVYNEGVWYTII